MSRIEIVELNITTTAVDKLWGYGLRPAQVRSVPSRHWVAARNRTDRAAPYLLIGHDDQGRCLTMPIVLTDDPLVWRVIAGWYCKRSEAAKLR
jgi:hypothetical protein